jgi:hypothetical protein
MESKTVTYAHKDDPSGTRYRAMASDAFPAWAVDVKPEIELNNNFFGYPDHPTDKYFDEVNTNEIPKILAIRAAYDLISSAGNKEKDALNFLLNSIRK